MGGTIAPIKKMVMTGGMGDGIVLTTLEIVDFRHADVTEMDIPEVNGCFDTVYKGKIWDSHEPYFNFVFFFFDLHMDLPSGSPRIWENHATLTNTNKGETQHMIL